MKVYPFLFILHADSPVFGKVEGAFCVMRGEALISCMRINLSYSEIMELFEEVERKY